MNPWIQTFTGRKFYPLTPDPDQVDIVDIAHSLAYQCRYLGHSKSFYSVAQHSVIVSQNVPSELALEGLLHDASEAYLGDVPSPLKHTEVWGMYRECEDWLQEVILRKFGARYPLHPDVLSIDKAVLLTESLSPKIMAPRHKDWEVEPTVLRESLADGIDPVAAWVAKEMFLSRFAEVKRTPCD